MFILEFLKFFSYIFTGVIILIIFIYHFFLFSDKGIEINQTTKTCLITGASSGIGKHLAIEMAKRGWKVIGIARREERLKNLASEIGKAFIPYACDVCNPEQVHNVCEKIKADNLKPTLFFLNAGERFTVEKFQPMFNKQKQSFDTNYFGVITWIDEWLNIIKTYGGGTFVVTSSVNAIFGGLSDSGNAGYGSSKAAIYSLFRTLGLRYRDDKIGFVSVLPGPVKTEMLTGDLQKQPYIHIPEDEARYIIKQVFKRKKQIEPSLYYSFCWGRFCYWAPDNLVLKIFG